MTGGAFADEWTDAGWPVYGVGSNVVKVVNMNKLTFREYAFNRLTGALKCICWNTSKAGEFYVNGESEITLTRNGEAAHSSAYREICAFWKKEVASIR